MIVDGKALAEQRIGELIKERAAFGPLTLGIVVMQEDPVTASFLRIKNRAAERLGVAVRHVSTMEDVGDADGVILQLPLPEGVDTDAERNRIPLFKDVDGLSDAAFAAFTRAEFPPPPVPRAMDYILKSYAPSCEGKKVAVIGQGRLVGRPAVELFRQRGAKVTVLTRGDDIAASTRDADIIVLGAGEPGLLKPDMVKGGAIILDAGTSESSGKVVGDADPACADRAALFTPVPGGIGPIAVVEIFANLFELKRMSTKS